MVEPRLRVRSSGLGGSGYVIPAIDGEPHKGIKNTAGETIAAKIDNAGAVIVLPGVTTINKHAGNEALIQWTANQTAAAAVMNLDYLSRRSEEVGYGFLRFYYKRKPDLADPVMMSYKRILDDSSELGTNIHEYMEARVKNEFPPDLNSTQAVEMAELVEGFLFENTVESLATELTVFGDGYAGTLDGIWVINGRSYLLDVKTARMIHESHMRQLAALDRCDYAFVEEDGQWKRVDIPEYDGYAFLHIRPTDIDDNGNMIPGFCRLEVVDEGELEYHYRAFRGLLEKATSDRELRKYKSRKEGKNE